MNKQIIENYLLISGQSRRHDIAALERRCQNAGFTAGRTGQFGVGVLSYFMVSDRLTLTTRRGLEAGDADPAGWIFETEGVGSWGELRRANQSDRGTRVELHLKRDVIEDVAVWYANAAKYLRNNLSVVPCQFHFNSPLAECEPLTLGPGWTKTETEFASVVLSRLRAERHGKETPRHLLPSEARAEEEQRDQRWKELREKAFEHLRWAKQEGDLPEGLGRYRLRLPYFHLPGGPSLLFMDLEERDDKRYVRQIGQGRSYHPVCPVWYSWKGIAVDIHRQSQTTDSFDLHDRYLTRMSQSGVCMEIDFRVDAIGKPEVDRSSLLLNKPGLDSFDYVLSESQKLIRHFLDNHNASSYVTWNVRFAEAEQLAIKKPEWISFSDADPERTVTWERIRFPVVDNASWSYSACPRKATWKGKDVCILPCVGEPCDAYHHKGISWCGIQYIHPDRVVWIRDWYRSVGLLWERNPLRTPASATTLITAKFPPSWKYLVAVRIAERPMVWNSAHRLARITTPEARDSVRAAQRAHSDPLAYRDELLCDRALGAAWLVQMLLGGQESIWKGLIDRKPDFLRDLWTLIFGKPRKSKEPTPLVYVDQRIGSRREVNVVDPDGWREYHATHSDVQQFMPDPGPDWTLEIHREAADVPLIEPSRRTKSKTQGKQQSTGSRAKTTRKSSRKRRKST